jgi:hypothetical protein
MISTGFDQGILKSAYALGMISTSSLLPYILPKNIDFLKAPQKY